jgi:protein involved in polysaccharide export with SLBB domain
MKLRKLLGGAAAVCGFLSLAFIITGCHSEPVQAYDQGQAATTGATGTTETPAASEGQTTNTTLIDPHSPFVIRKGDLLVISFSDIPGPKAFEPRVGEEGTITLEQNKAFNVIGKTVTDLAKEIRAAYVPEYYTHLTVDIKPLERFFYVLGEVKSPGQHPYVRGLNVLKAVSSAGDFTDFANRRKVELNRGQDLYIIDCVKARRDPRYDMDVLPDDKITVPRRFP